MASKDAGRKNCLLQRPAHEDRPSFWHLLAWQQNTLWEPSDHCHKKLFLADTAWSTYARECMKKTKTSKVDGGEPPLPPHRWIDEKNSRQVQRPKDENVDEWRPQCAKRVSPFPQSKGVNFE